MGINFTFPLRYSFLINLSVKISTVSKKANFCFFNWKLWKIPCSENVCGSRGKEFLELLLKLVNGKMLNVVTE